MRFLVTKFAICLIVFVMPIEVFSQSYSTVYNGKLGNNSPLWGANASKACHSNGSDYFVAQQENEVERLPELYRKTGNNWALVWTGTAISRQPPVTICKKTTVANVDTYEVHVIYNQTNGNIKHYKFVNGSATPSEISTTNIGGNDIHYLSAVASSTSNQLYLAAREQFGTTGNLSYRFNLYYFYGPTSTWYGPYRQKVAWENGTGWVDQRNDGAYLYPVIVATGHRIFTAAGLFAINSNFDSRKQWVFWDSAYYGQSRVDHYYKDVVSGDVPYTPSSATHDYYVAPDVMSQAEDGTIFILVRTSGPNAPANQLGYDLQVYSNGKFIKYDIPNIVGLAGMTATDRAVFVVDSNKVHYSCNRGKTWNSLSHQSQAQVNRLTQKPIYNAGYVHVMNEVLDDSNLEAFFSFTFDNPIESEIVNLSYDVGNICTN